MSSHSPYVLHNHTYEEIVSVIKSYRHRRDCLQVLAMQFPFIPNETLLSIYSQLYQQYTKKSHHTHRQLSVMQEYYEQYQRRKAQKETDATAMLLLEMANEVDSSPTLFARIILEEYIRRNDVVSTDAGPTNIVSQWIKSPHLITDTPLRQQVSRCIQSDANYGPLADNLKHSVGYQYEFLLLEKVKQLNVPFLDEKALSLRGYDKTPDVKLEVPIAVDGYIVNWIESKASFGDETNHSKYCEEQFWSYTNRFGSGLVIYWFGYIKELDIHKKQGILLTSSFPQQSTMVLLAN